MVLIILALFGLVGIIVNFRKPNTHNLLSLTPLGWVLFAIGLPCVIAAACFQIKDFKDNNVLGEKLISNHKQDSLERIIQNGQLKDGINQSLLPFKLFLDKDNKVASINNYTTNYNTYNGLKQRHIESYILDSIHKIRRLINGQIFSYTPDKESETLALEYSDTLKKLKYKISYDENLSFRIENDNHHYDTTSFVVYPLAKDSFKFVIYIYPASNAR